MGAQPRTKGPGREKGLERRGTEILSSQYEPDLVRNYHKSEEVPTEDQKDNESERLVTFTPSTPPPW